LVISSCEQEPKVTPFLVTVSLPQQPLCNGKAGLAIP
jgi:hypothetical protein